MLSKLFRYEMKSVARLLLPMYGAVLLLSVINRLTLLFFSSNTLFAIPQIMLTTMYVLLVVAVILLTFVLMVQRFYKNLLRKEGYLMFTLPVSTSSHILAKALCAFIWIMATLVITLASVVITIPDSSWITSLPELWNSISATLTQQSLNPSLILTLLIITIPVAILYFLSSAYAAMAFGQLSNNHKLACSFGAYIGIYFAAQLVTATALGIYMACAGYWDLLVISTEMVPAFVYGILLITMGLNLLFTVILFIVTRHLLRKRLNLE